MKTEDVWSKMSDVWRMKDEGWRLRAEGWGLKNDGILERVVSIIDAARSFFLDKLLKEQK